MKSRIHDLFHALVNIPSYSNPLKILCLPFFAFSKRLHSRRQHSLCLKAQLPVYCLQIYQRNYVFLESYLPTRALLYQYTPNIKPLLQQVPVFIKTTLAALGSATNRFQAIGDRAYTSDKMRYTAMLRRETS